MKLSTTLAVLCLSVALGYSQSTIVNYDSANDYAVSGGPSFQGKITDGNGTNSIPFSMTQQMNPIVGINPDPLIDDHYDPLGSGIFYGGIGISTPSGVSGGADVTQIRSSDTIRWRLQGNSATGDKAAGLFIWQQSNWESLASGSGVAIDGFSLTGRKYGTNSSQSHMIHFVVQEAGQFYVSEHMGGSHSTGFPDGFEAVTLTNPEGVSWFNYDPSTDMFVIGAAATPSLTDITAVGFFHLATDLDGSYTTHMTIDYSNFSVTAVPEPATIALMLSALSLGLVLYRRRTN